MESRRAEREAAKLTELRDRVHRAKRHEHGVRILYTTSDGSDAGAWAPFPLPEQALAFFEAEVAKHEARDEASWRPVQVELIQFGAITRVTSFAPPPAG